MNLLVLLILGIICSGKTGRIQRTITVNGGRPDGAPLSPRR